MLELTAINEMLSVLGETPLSSLTAPLPADATIAQGILANTSKAIQEQGWHFNTEEDVEFTPVAGQIAIDPDIYAKVDHKIEDYVVRGGFLYDLEKKADDEFGTTVVELDVVYYQDFTEVPEPFARWIVARAAKLLQRRVLGSTEINAQLQQEENEAQRDAVKYNEDLQDANMADNYDVFKVIDR